VESLKGIRTSQVVDVLDATLGAHFFGDDESIVDARLSAIEDAAREGAAQIESAGGYPTVAFDPEELSSTRRCPSCDTGRLGLKLSRTGGFIGCSNYPSCGHTRQLVSDGDADGGANFPMELGTDPESGGLVAIQNGPYGPYIELQMPSSPDDSEKTKPQRFGLKNISLKPEDVSMELATTLLRYPMVLGIHPEDGKDVVMNMGPFGWYVSHDGVNASLSKKVLQKARDDAVAAVCVSFGDEELVDVADDFVNVDGGEGDDTSIEGDGRTLNAEQKRMVLLAQHSPVPLDVAVEVLTRKREKPPSERGRWGKKKETATKGKAKVKKEKPEKVKAKRAPSAYLLYCGEARSKLPEGLKVPEQAKLLGAQWKALDGSEKVKFEQMAAEAKAAIADAAPKTKAKGKGANGEPKPKRAPSAYILYCSEARPKLPEGLRVPEQAKLLGAQWKTLDAVEKARFEGMAADAKLQANAR
jgi:DNA topoisomerase-1